MSRLTFDAGVNSDPNVSLVLKGVSNPRSGFILMVDKSVLTKS